MYSVHSKINFDVLYYNQIIKKRVEKMKINVLVAMDSFKGSLTSKQVNQAVEKGIRNVFPNADIYEGLLADGGEGTVDAFLHYLGGKRESITVTGPLGKQIQATYGIVNLENEKTAVIEMAEAAGLTLVPPDERNPLFTTTYGVGELILDAAKKGCRNFLIGIGGSATNDGGVGMLQALGYDFLNAEGKQIAFGAQGLKELASVSDENKNPILEECSFLVACDVKNPLCGKEGCSAVFGPQKGADEQLVQDMDAWLHRYARLCVNLSDKADAEKEGAGAAGGLGFAFLTFLGAELQSGISLLMEKTDIENEIKKTDIIITGEGTLDAQTAMGKGPMGIAKLAKKYDKEVIAFAGCLMDGVEKCHDNGIDAYFSILKNPAQKNILCADVAEENLTDTVTEVFRVIQLSGTI